MKLFADGKAVCGTVVWFSLALHDMLSFKRRIIHFGSYFNGRMLSCCWMELHILCSFRVVLSCCYYLLFGLHYVIC